MQSRIIILAIIFGLALPGVALSKDMDDCLGHLRPLEIQKDVVVEMGGLWTLFEQTPLLRDHSTRAMQSDSRMSELLELLQYLCSTIHGVPFNDLAVYLSNNLELKSKQEFKKEHLILGKSEAEIDIWLAFFDISLETQYRQFELASIEAVIRKAQPLFKRYRTLALEIRENPNETHLELLQAINSGVSELESSETYLKQALHELAQIPYWDIDENYGGS